MTGDNQKLDEEIGRHRSDVRTTQWQVSIGELFSLYEREQLQINPAFQRFFRWTDVQKTYLVESILLGLPIPPVFLAQSQDGKLEVVDGVQRISTLLQLRGVLESVDPATGQPRGPLILTKGQYLTELDGLVWDEATQERAGTLPGFTGHLSDAQRSDILFAKFDATVIQRLSTGQAKYDVFRRLNSYGEPLTPQEMRAALIASVSGDALTWISELARSDETAELLSLSDRQIERQYDVELVLRFFFLAERERLRASDLRDFSTVLDDFALELAEHYPDARTARLDSAFRQTMARISADIGPDFFRRYHEPEDRFKGPFLNTSFEALASALGYQILRRRSVPDNLAQIAKRFWQQPELGTRFATGRSTEWRLATYVPIGRRLLSEAG